MSGEGPGSADDVLRLSCRALGSSAHLQRDRIDLRYDSASYPAGQGRVLQNVAAVDALQARNLRGELVPAHQGIRLACAGDQWRAVRRWHQTGQHQSAAQSRRLIMSAIHNI